MSAKLMGTVWDLDVPHHQQNILLALADHAQDDGTGAYPSIDYLCWKTGYKERNVQHILAQLQDAGIIEAVAHERGGRGYSVSYDLHLENAPRKAPFEGFKGSQLGRKKPSERVQQNAPLQNQKGAISDTERVQNSAQKGAISDTCVHRVPARLTTIEPSEEPSELVCEYDNVPPRVEPTAKPTHTQQPSIVSQHRNPPTPPVTQTGILTPQRQALRDAVLNLTGKATQFEMGRVSDRFKRELSSVLLMLEEQGQTPADVETYRAKLPVFFNKAPDDVTPPQPGQMLDNWDAVMQFNPTRKTNGNHNPQPGSYNRFAAQDERFRDKMQFISELIGTNGINSNG